MSTATGLTSVPSSMNGPSTSTVASAAGRSLSGSTSPIGTPARPRVARSVAVCARRDPGRRTRRSRRRPIVAGGGDVPVWATGAATSPPTAIRGAEPAPSVFAGGDARMADRQTDGGRAERGCRRPRARRRGRVRRGRRASASRANERRPDADLGGRVRAHDPATGRHEVRRGHDRAEPVTQSPADGVTPRGDVRCARGSVGSVAGAGVQGRAGMPTDAFSNTVSWRGRPGRLGGSRVGRGSWTVLGSRF